MKKTLVAIAALAVVSAASAQVVISGAVGLAVTANNGGTAISTPDFNVNFGVTEDLGGGLTLAAKAGIDLGNGRDALTDNRDKSLSLKAKSGAELAYASSDSTSRTRLSMGGVISTGVDLDDLYGSNAESSSLTFKSPIMNDFQLTYGFSQPTQASTTTAVPMTTGSAFADSGTVGISYAKGPLAFSADYKSATNRARANVSYDLGVAVLEAHMNSEAYVPATASLAGYDDPKSGLTEVGVAVPMGALTFGAGLSTNGYVKGVAMGVKYALSKQTALQFATVNLANGSGTVAHSSGPGQHTRLKLVKSF